MGCISFSSALFFDSDTVYFGGEFKTASRRAFRQAFAFPAVRGRAGGRFCCAREWGEQKTHSRPALLAFFCPPRLTREEAKRREGQKVRPLSPKTAQREAYAAGANR